jgi:CBS domain-containing protein
MIKNCMNSQVYVIAPDETISRARNLMLKHGIGRLIVIEDGEPVGVLTKKDIMHRLSHAEPAWRRRPIDNIPIKIVMTENPLTIHQEATAAQAAEIMLENEISGLPVVKEDNGRTKLVGIITKQDLIRYYSEKNYDTKVSDIMDNYIVTVNRHHTIDHVLDEMEENRVNLVVVVSEKNNPVGLVSTDNIAFTELTDAEGNPQSKEVKMARRDTSAGVKRYRYIKEVPLTAEDIMSPLDMTVASNQRAVDAAKAMISTGIKALPVVDDSLVGILQADNILKEIKKQT